MPDTYYAVACVILLAALGVVSWRLMVTVADYRFAFEGWKRVCALHDETKAELRGWRDAYYSRDAQLTEARAQIAKFDHDGDGKIGGSRSHETICTNSGGGYVENAAKRTQAAL